MYDKNNVFAKILRGEIPSNKIYENKYAMTFMDVNPKAPIHVLVIPRGEYVDLLDFQMNASAHEQVGFWKAVKSSVKKLNLEEKSYRCVANTGAPLQEVFHFHLHIMANDPADSKAGDWIY